MSFLNWLASTALVNWLITTSWVYPWVISFHSIGMGFLVGIIFVIVLRVFGLLSFPLAPLERFLFVVQIAFGVSLLTGITLFIIDAEHFFFSPTFRIKMLLIVLGAIMGLILTRMIFGTGPAGPPSADSGKAKVVAGLTFVCWAGAIFAGRLTAYLP